MSFMDYEIIYHRRYPKEDLTKLVGAKLSEEERLQADKELDRIFEKLEAQKPDPKRERMGARFVELARSFSEYFEIDADIKRYENRLTADFYSPCYYFGGDTLERFLELAGMCEDFSVTPDAKGRIVAGLSFSLV